MTLSHKFAACCVAAALLSATAGAVHGREAPVTFTTEEDHQHMLQQLGVTRLRPGRSGNADSPNAANYDESAANPYPAYPELLTLDDGRPVATAQQWWEVRRPEIVAAFESEVVGRIPENVPTVTWELRQTRDAAYGDVDAVEKEVVGVIDNSACPSIEVEIEMSLAVPKGADGPVPVLVMFGRTPFDESPDPWARFRPAGPSRQEVLLSHGWGVAMLNPRSVQADNGAGLTRGVIGLTNLGQPRKPQDWGSLRAWGWGASRGLDYLLTDPAVDGEKVGVEGVSRYGKAALVAMAFDQRFAIVLIGSSGEGGASPYRRDFGESVENLTGAGEYHWMAGAFLKYGAEEASFGRLDANDLPVDSHQLIALCAPRLTFVSYGIPERGDALWLDQLGSFRATVAASRVFEILGVEGLGVSGDFQSASLPAVNEGLLDGRLAWRQHDGGHTDAPNITHFVQWAERQLASSSAR